MRVALPRRDAVLEILARTRRPLAAEELAERLRVPPASVPGFSRFLADLAMQGELVLDAAHRFSTTALSAPPQRPSPRAEERRGTLSADARGFGFVRSPGSRDDLYIPEHAMAGALHGDAVLARVVRKTVRGLEGEIVSVVERGRARVAGTLRRRGKSAWLEPDDARVRGPIVLSGPLSGADGDAAVVELTRYPELPEENPEGSLLAALGEPGDLQVEVKKVLLREAIAEEHPRDAEDEARAFGGEVSADELAGREDFTGLPLPTIDPEDARDHDDAVWVERHDDGTFTATVAIADVSHYVREGSALDREARERSFTLYLPSRAIPMLPPALSSSLCSLLPDTTRLCVAVVVRLDQGANVVSSRITKGFLRSRAKLTYGAVARALGWTKEGRVSKAAEALAPGLRVADQLAQMLRTKRIRRGALDLSLPEPKIVLDPETGAPTDVVRRAEDPGVKRAYQLIEELMLLANEVVAGFVVERHIPAIFRVHAPPDEERLERFATFAEALGVTMEPADRADPKRFSVFVRKLSKHPRADVLSTLLLRSLKQASYATDNVGHFGLASPAYLHFTSPIRRYPDTLVHRLVKRALDERTLDRSDEGLATLRDAATSASLRERKIADIEQEIANLYRVVLLRDKLGQSFEGTVTAVTTAGAFVALDAPFVEVLVRPEAMGKDRYSLDEERLLYLAPRSGDAVRWGDRIVVTAEEASIPRRTVYAWRHPPGSGEHGPLKHTPFEKRGRADQKAPDPRHGPQPRDRDRRPKKGHAKHQDKKRPPRGRR